MKAVLNHNLSWLLIPLLVVLLYARTFRFDYIYYDDVSLIESAKQVSQSNTPIADVFSQGAFGQGVQQDTYYRPVLSLSFFVDTLFNSPAAFRFSNMLFHMLACLLFFLLLLEFKFDRSLAILMALLFAAHPLMAQAVAWIPGRNDSLLAIFIVLACIGLIKYLRSGFYKNLILFGIAFFAALFTKESALFFIPVLLVVAFSFMKSSKEGILTAMVLAVAASLYFIIRNQVMEASVTVPILVLFKATAINIAAIPMFAAQAILPLQLSALPVFSLALSVAGSLVIALLLYFIFQRKAWSKLTILGTAWFLCSALPALIPNTFAHEMIFLNHRLYLPLLGLIVVFVSLLQNSWHKQYVKYSVWGVLIIYCLLNSIYTSVFKSELDFYANATKQSPKSSFAWKGYGVCLQAKGDAAGAISAYQTALTINVGIPEVRNNLARIFINQKEFVQSEKLLIEELQLDSTHSMAYYNLATIRIEQGKLPEAIQYLQKSVQHGPTNIEALNDLAALLAQQGQYTLALDYVNRILAINPAYEPALRNQRMLQDLLRGKQ